MRGWLNHVEAHPIGGVGRRGRSGVGEAEPVGAERDVGVGDPLPDLLGDPAHPVRDRDHRPGGTGKRLGDVGGAGWAVGVAQLLSLYFDPVTVQLARPIRRAPPGQPQEEIRYRLRLTNASVVSITSVYDAAGGAREEIALAFEKIDIDGQLLTRP